MAVSVQSKAMGESAHPKAPESPSSLAVVVGRARGWAAYAAARSTRSSRKKVCVAALAGRETSRSKAEAQRRIQRVRERLGVVRTGPSASCDAGGLASDMAKHMVATQLAQQMAAAPLTLEQVRCLDADGREATLGERIYALVALLPARRPGKVTGMLLDGLEPEELLAFLMPPAPAEGAAVLAEWVTEACKVLTEDAALASSVESSTTSTPIATPAATPVATPMPSPKHRTDGFGGAADTVQDGAAHTAHKVGGPEPAAPPAAPPADPNEWQVVSGRKSRRRSSSSAARAAPPVLGRHARDASCSSASTISLASVSSEDSSEGWF